MSSIEWREWGTESFELARKLDRPILLDIGAVWCHWCHVMDHGIPGDPVHTGTYSNPEVAELITERFVPIKVDNDRRPDINTRYNQGGWPTTVFLTPDGDMLYGETYVEPKRMLSLLKYVSEYYAGSKEEIAEKLAEHAAAMREADQATPPVDLPPPGAPAAIVRQIKSNFDPAYGGFGTQPKFPHAEALLFALEEWRRGDDPALRQVVELSLEGMAGGGMYDQFAGGFFRYSTTRDWSIPHYEKMLHDNARLSQVCLLAGAVFEDRKFTDIAVDVHNWLMTVMRNPDTGCFAGSQDADKEERYYGRPLAEREHLPTPFIDWTVYVDWNAQLVSSLATRAKLTGDSAVAGAAEKCYRFLADHVFPHHYWADGAAGGETHQLIDIVAMIDAAIDLHEWSGAPEYLADALRFADTLLTELHDTAGGGFFDIRVSPGAIGALARPRVEIGASSDACLALIRLSTLTQKPRYREAALTGLSRFARSYANYSFFAAPYGRAVAAALAEPVHVIVVGDPVSESAQALRRAVWTAAPIGPAVESRSAEEAGEYPPSADGSARAYVCVGTVCQAPASTPEELTAQLNGMGPT